MKMLIIIFVIVFVGVGCSHEVTITHLPFKVKNSDRWGLIGTDGKILFENEFEEKPSAVVNNIFYVKNPNGMYEYYTAEKKPKKIGDKTYSQAGYFLEDVAPVTEPEQGISFIHKDGSVAFKLDHYEDTEIVSVCNFSDGLAQFCTVDGKYGYVNTRGEIVVPPIYTDTGGFHEGLATVWVNDTTAWVINIKGEKLFDLDARHNKDGYIAMFYGYNGGMMACGYGKPASDDIWKEYYIDKKGEKIFRIESFSIESDFCNGRAISAKWLKEKVYMGIVDKTGKEVIRPKYEGDPSEMEYGFGGYIAEDFACLNDRGKYGLVDFKDNVICPFKFDEIFHFYDRKHAFAKERDVYYLIDTHGKEVDHKEYDVVSECYIDNYIKTDYWDVSGALEDILAKLQEDRIEPIFLGMTLEEVRKCYTISQKKESLSGQYSMSLEGRKREDIESVYIPLFTNPIVSYSYWGGGYQFNSSAKIRHIIVGLDLKKNVEHKLERIDREMRDWLDKRGFQWYYNTKWDGSDWDLYRKADSKYLIGITKQYRRVGGEYNLVISSE